MNVKPILYTDQSVGEVGEIKGLNSVLDYDRYVLRGYMDTQF